MTQKFTKTGFLLAFVISFQVALAQPGTITGKVTDRESGKPLAEVEVFLVNTNHRVFTKGTGEYNMRVQAGTYQIAVYLIDRKSETKDIEVAPGQNIQVNFALQPLEILLDEIFTTGRKEETSDISRLNSVEGTWIYEAKKNEVIHLDHINANMATNNARQVFAKVPGLNIWESDAAGLQLGIGGRGLNPNRTSNFNTRQNGYDIAADPMGYPESYYTPPVESLEKIEVVRGAASLQYGTQFGGMINFLFKRAPEGDPFTFHTRNTVGSYGLFSSYNSIYGNTGKTDYFAFYQRKQGDGWHENEQFKANTLFTDVNFHLGEKWFLCFEFTHMDYLAQQPGGLTDRMFEEDPRQSVRSRNWFNINWNIPAVVLEYSVTSRTKINLKTFGLIGSRKALGNLESVTVADIPEENRNLLWDDFLNFGSELRILHHYDISNKPQALAVGMRYFEGHTQKRQGEANNSADPDFYFLNPDRLEDSDFTFPSRNLAFFAENIINLNQYWSITPGFRAEYIDTQSEGYYRESREDLAGNVIFDTTTYETKNRERAFFLAGVGVSYKPTDEIEAYGNFAQNYRAINFNDLRVNNPNLKVDENLEDERGFNADLGIRGAINKLIYFDWSVFYLRYNDRIGAVWKKEIDPLFGERSFRFRTNIADAYIAGLETFTEVKLGTLLFSKKSPSDLSAFVNAALIQGKYVASQESAFQNKKVEWVPPLNVKAGLSYDYKNFSSTLQYTYVTKQYSEATNTLKVASGVDGLIPSYYVVDLSFKYKYKFARLEAGVNNLTGNAYFTRRATGYPGPGIISSPGRQFFITLDVRL